MNSAQSILIHIQSDVECPPGIETLLAAAVETALRIEGVSPPVVVALLLTDDQHIQDLNHLHRGIDAATDVLSFSAGDPMPGMEALAPHLGDIVISVPFANRQAMAQGHELEEELQLLAVHGTLHLLGYDHAREAEKLDMWQSQGTIMAELQLDHVLPSEDGHG